MLEDAFVRGFPEDTGTGIMLSDESDEIDYINRELWKIKCLFWSRNTIFCSRNPILPLTVFKEPYNKMLIYSCSYIH